MSIRTMQDCTRCEKVRELARTENPENGGWRVIAGPGCIETTLCAACVRVMSEWARLRVAES